MSDMGVHLLNVIETASPEEALVAIGQYKAGMMDPLSGAHLVGWVSIPANLMELQSKMEQFQGVPRKLMSIKRTNATRVRRALLMVQAMELALKKVHNL